VFVYGIGQVVHGIVISHLHKRDYIDLKVITARIGPMVFKDRELRKIFRPQTDEKAGQCRRLYTPERILFG
jgi:hypothetical protein